jgi:hypothetical protein
VTRKFSETTVFLRITSLNRSDSLLRRSIRWLCNVRLPFPQMAINGHFGSSKVGCEMQKVNCDACTACLFAFPCRIQRSSADTSRPVMASSNDGNVNLTQTPTRLNKRITPFSPPRVSSRPRGTDPERTVRHNLERRSQATLGVRVRLRYLNVRRPSFIRASKIQS